MTSFHVGTYLVWTDTHTHTHTDQLLHVTLARACAEG